MDKLMNRNRASVNDLMNAIEAIPPYDILQSIIREHSSAGGEYTRNFEWLQNIAKKERKDNIYCTVKVEILGLIFRLHGSIYCFRDPIIFQHYSKEHVNFALNYENTINYSIAELFRSPREHIEVPKKRPSSSFYY